MMKLMYKEEGGFCNVHEDGLAAAQADGWVDGEPIRQKLLAAKKASVAVATSVKPPIMGLQPSAKPLTGRSLREVPSILNDRKV